MSGRVSRYLRDNVLGLVAIFIALNAGGYAAANSGEQARDGAGGGAASNAVDGAPIAGAAGPGSELRARAVKGRHLANRSVSPRNLRMKRIRRVLQRRVKPCARGEAIRRVRVTGAVVCAPLAEAGISGIETSGGLTGGGETGMVSLGVDPSVIQSRIDDDCVGDGAITSIDEDGNVTCEAGAGGTVTEVDSGFGLSGGPITGSGELAVDPATVQRRVSAECADNNAIRSIDEDGNVECRSAVTSLSAGTGLTGGTITDSGTIAVNPATTQSRVSGSCTGDQAVQSITQPGGVNCSPAFKRATSLLTPSGGETTGRATVFSANGLSLINDCTDGTNARVIVAADASGGFNVVRTTHGGPQAASTVAAGSEVVIASTTGIVKGDFVALANAGPNVTKTVSGSFYSFKTGSGSCQVAAYGVAS